MGNLPEHESRVRDLPVCPCCNNLGDRWLDCGSSASVPIDQQDPSSRTDRAAADLLQLEHPDQHWHGSSLLMNTCPRSCLCSRFLGSACVFHAASTWRGHIEVECVTSYLGSVLWLVLVSWSRRAGGVHSTELAASGACVACTASNVVRAKLPQM